MHRRKAQTTKTRECSYCLSPNPSAIQTETLLSDDTVTDVEKITEASQRIGQIIAELDEKELRWLELDEIM